MKFKDLKEGKMYEIKGKESNGVVYEKKEGLLCCKEDNIFSDFSFAKASLLDFEEAIAYVSLQEAIEHMKKGGKAKFYYDKDDVFSNEYNMSKSHYGYYVLRANPDYVTGFCDVHMQNKWILLRD